MFTKNKNPKAMYFMALVPGQEIWDQVMEFKKIMANEFNCRFPLKLPPHLTIQIPFFIREKGEDKDALINTLSAFAQREAAFKLFLEGFGHFRKEVIYIRVANEDQVLGFQHRLTGTLKKMPVFPGKRLQPMTRAHITIGNKDLRPRFNEAWAYFKDLEYQAGFNVNAIILLRHNRRFWEFDHTMSLPPIS